MSTTPIGDYALVSNCHCAGLVGAQGSVDWLCFPRFDRPSVLGRLLDERAGHWSLRPVQDARTTRRYVDDTMVLETTYWSQSGTCTLTDAMALDPTEHGHDLGAGAPRLLVRVIECVEGEMELETEYAPRPEYGLISPLLSHTDGGIAGR